MPNLILLWMAGVAVALGACTADMSTNEGQCEAARKAKLAAELEGLDADTVRHADVAIALTCPSE